MHMWISRWIDHSTPLLLEVEIRTDSRAGDLWRAREVARYSSSGYEVRLGLG